MTGPAPKRSYILPAVMRGALADSTVMIMIVLAIAVSVFFLGGPAAQRVVTYAAIMLTAVLSLQIFSGNTGIVSFGHAGFLGLGAYITGILTMPVALQQTALKQLPEFLAGYQLPFLAALAVAAIIGIAIGAITGTPLLRLSGSGASIATLALLIIIYTLLVAAREITRGSQPFYGVPREVGLWTATAIAALGLLVARVFRESPLGLAARAAANDERGAAAVGVNRRLAWFASWLVSVIVAFVTGALFAQFLGAFSPKDFYFDLGFTMLAMLIVGGMNSSLGAFAGVIVTTVVIEVVRRMEGGSTVFGIELPALFGLTQGVLAIAMILIIWRRPDGLFGRSELNILRRVRDDAQSVGPQLAPEPKRITSGGIIAAKGLSRRYAGVLAVDNISLEFRTDMITGIIGPNGAGKTTFINMISGDVVPSSGEVTVDAPLASHSAFRFARAGIARTFQNIRIFSRMTVLENVLVAARQVEPDLASAEAAAWRELHRMELAEHATRDAEGLAYGLRRRLEIARALALKPRFLLLDEPAAGMNAVETASLVEILATVRADRGIGIILIEHDMRLVMNLCERIVVIDHGKVIADGAPQDIRSNPAVIAAYLGSRGAKTVTSEPATALSQ
ncbi:branched-chain amino acid ABC transporter ATP-binding protein/permease [Rhizobium sp. PL01]|uniref:branched-chain amino acid ABC transporter ATP-binding protein/permease n=1 Tax=Rhizobium sp. PL01 TaxID=3085631 RepID=UPI0029828EDC|nr:branched-chain amino acid ABC transporter ATP-binding protein/permease [Rhizobium sp. PL01]MDW5316116.1 branched-chain amino acid ABC transporter ATP-binding protein/permease [Rhizobium sp. PL01]